MFESLATQFSQYSKQLTDATLRANAITTGYFETLTSLQTKALEARLQATSAFASEAAEVRDLEAAKAFFPKSVAFVKDASEQLYALGQETLKQNIKTAEALATIAKANFEAANESIVRPAVKAAKAKA